MGFSTIVSNVMMFITLSIVFVALILIYGNYVKTTNNALSTQEDRFVSKINTKLTIATNTTYNAGKSFALVFVTNSGSTTLNGNNTEVYVDSVRILRTQREFWLLPSTNVANPKMWNPGEVARFNITSSLIAGYHQITITTENGISTGTVIQV